MTRYVLILLLIGFKKGFYQFLQQFIPFQFHVVASATPPAGGSQGTGQSLTRSVPVSLGAKVGAGAP